MSTDVDVTAYVDGELDVAAIAAFEARLRIEPALQSQVERAQRLRAMLKSSYAPVMDEAVPQRLKDALRRPGNVESLDAARSRRRWTPTWAQLGGMAASVLLGLLIGNQIQPTGTSLQANGELAQALNSKLSGEKLGRVSLGLSFVAKGGAYCRSFTADDRAGLACRDGEGWQLRQLVPAPKTADSAEYRTAASTLPPALLAAVDELREGEVLDAKQEASARDKGWR